MITIKKTELSGVALICPDIFEDFRGQYIETYNEAVYREKFRLFGINPHFIQDDISVSTKDVLRGIHGDYGTTKLISCLHGKFYLVVVDCRKDSKNFGKWEAFTLSDRNRWQVLISPGYGNAHLILSDMAIFHYKQTTYYEPSRQFTYHYDDPRFNIYWPIKNPILSERDQG